MPIFLFTDIENSTRLWETHREIMGEMLFRHDKILSEKLIHFGGRVIKHRGDGVFAVFESGDPLACALEIQKALQREEWGEIGELRIRVALHAGTADKRGDDYFGPAVNRTARILDIGWGGQTLVTPEAKEACSVPVGATLQDLGVHYLKDLNEPQQVFGLLHPDITLNEFPPLRSLSNHPNNLPSQTTAFVGRGKELFDIAALLDKPECRLITLLGPGGIGKTRLAIQAASERSDAFSHGAYFVELAPLASADLLIPAIAQSLRFTFYGQGDPKAQLLKYLREKKMLLVLDNFEHLLDGAPLASEILAAAPGVKIIVTSRERLNLKGEWIDEVSGMQVPLSETADLESYGAIQLFLETARRVSPDFSLNAESAPYVVHICQLLMGMPLGIELAASWARALSCEEIAREISESLDFLATQLRDTPERHRSLRAVFDHSWKLLSEYEKSALKKIAVFRGGFSKEAAKIVSGASLPILSLLVDKSLLRKMSAARYELHPMVRQFSDERWEENAAERTHVRDLHAGYYAEFLHCRESGLKGGKQIESLREIGGEIENVRASWARLVEKRNSEQIGKALHPLYLFFRMQNYFHEGEETFRKAAAAITGDPRIARLLSARHGALLRLIGQYGKAKQLMEESLNFFQEIGLADEAAFCCTTLGEICTYLGEYDLAEKLIREGLAAYGETGDRFAMTVALLNLGRITWILGEYQKARNFYRESLVVSRETCDEFGMSASMTANGLVALTLGDYAEARLLFQEGLALAERIGDRRTVMISKHHLGCAAFLLNDYVEAREFLEESLALSEEIGDRLLKGMSLEDLGLVEIAAGRRERAAEILAESLRIYREDGNRWGIASCLNSMATAAMESGDTRSARRLFGESLAETKEIEAIPLMLEILAGTVPLIQEKHEEEAEEIVALIFSHPMAARTAKDKVAGFNQAGEKQTNPDDLNKTIDRVLYLLTEA